MKGVRFYLEFPTATAKHKSGKANSGHAGNVIAATCDAKGHYWRMGQNNEAVMDVFAPLYDRPDSPVCSTSASLAWMRLRCKRIKEATARNIHPEMFHHIDPCP